jgi:hypothetical protein
MTLEVLEVLAADVVEKYDARLRDEVCALAFFQAVEKMRTALGPVVDRTEHVPTRLADTLPVELQAMTHISKVLGSLSESGRFRAIVVIALAMAPDAFSESEYAALARRAKGR